MTQDDYRAAVLQVADDDGRIHPPSLTDWFLQMQILLAMSMDGLIENRNRMDEPYRWFITDKGRAALEAYNSN